MAKKTVTPQESADPTEILNRLRRVEGQIRGLQRMIEEQRDCAEIVHQLAAARAALDRVGHLVVSTNLRRCLTGAELSGPALRDLEKGLAALAQLQG